MPKPTAPDFREVASDILRAWARFTDNIDSAKAKIECDSGEVFIVEAGVEMFAALVKDAKGQMHRFARNNGLDDPWGGLRANCKPFAPDEEV